MSIILPNPIQPLSEQAFHKLDYAIMALAFEVHNLWGRFYDEQIYQNELKQRCLDSGLEVESELEIKLTHKNYSKSLFIDLLINGCVYELKTIKSIQEQQRIQTLDYLFATDTRHGKIINFRPASVEHEFISTTLDNKCRKQIKIQDKRWRDCSDQASKLKNLMLDLLDDWGAFFDTHLYEEALIHLFGGEQEVIRPVDIKNETRLLGHQKFNTLSKSEFFIITAARNNISQHETHLKRLLSHTPFKHPQWINLNHSEIQFTTLEK